jgi:hypothetical protein
MKVMSRILGCVFLFAAIVGCAGDDVDFEDGDKQDSIEEFTRVIVEPSTHLIASEIELVGHGSISAMKEGENGWDPTVSSFHVSGEAFRVNPGPRYFSASADEILLDNFFSTMRLAVWYQYGDEFRRLESREGVNLFESVELRPRRDMDSPEAGAQLLLDGEIEYGYVHIRSIAGEVLYGKECIDRDPGDSSDCRDLPWHEPELLLMGVPVWELGDFSESYQYQVTATCLTESYEEQQCGGTPVLD